MARSACGRPLAVPNPGAALFAALFAVLFTVLFTALFAAACAALFAAPFAVGDGNLAASPGADEGHCGAGLPASSPQT